MIRSAKKSDAARVTALAERFHQIHGVGPQGFVAEDFAATVERLIERGAVFLSDDGAIGLYTTQSAYDYSKTLAIELFFWAPDGQGDGLRKAAEAWAAEHADALVMSAHEPADRASNWYRRKGYEPLSRQFAKVT